MHLFYKCMKPLDKRVYVAPMRDLEKERAVRGIDDRPYQPLNAVDKCEQRSPSEQRDR